MRTSFILFLLIALFSLSCTVQKRVYQKGWHVQWRSAPKSASKIAQSDLILVEPKDRETADKNLLNTYPRIEQQALMEDESDVSYLPKEVEMLVIQPSSKEEDFHFRESEDHIGLTIKRNTQQSVGHWNPKSESSEKEGSSVGLVLVIVGLVIAALSTLILMAAISSESSTIGIAGGVLLAALSAFFVALGLFYMIRRIRERKHPEKRAERLERIRKKKASPDYNPDRFNIVVALLSVTIVTVLFLFLSRS